jgi:hypothetical protein
MRLDVAPRGRAAVRQVVEADPFVVTARGGQHGQGLGRHHDRLAVAGHRDGVGLQRVHPSAQPGREHLLELDQRPDRRLVDALDRADRRRTQPDGDRHRLVVVEEQRRQGRAHAEPVAALHAERRVDRVAELAQPVDVAPHGPHGHLEPFGQLRAGPFAAGLQ